VNQTGVVRAKFTVITGIPVRSPAMQGGNRVKSSTQVARPSMAEPNLTPQMQQQLAQLQSLNGQLQATMQQKAQYEAMKAESEQALDALNALPDGSAVYRSVGALLLKDDKATALARLKEDAETMEVRVARLVKQETSLKETMASLQAKLQASLK
jgi:prefoldin beta subunit